VILLVYSLNEDLVCYMMLMQNALTADGLT